jgi:hypothetical protein
MSGNEKDNQDPAAERAVLRILESLRGSKDFAILQQAGSDSFWTSLPSDLAQYDVPNRDYPHEVHILAIRDPLSEFWVPAIEVIDGVFHRGNFHTRNSTLELASNSTCGFQLFDSESKALRHAHKLRVSAMRGFLIDMKISKNIWDWYDDPFYYSSRQAHIRRTT